MKEECFPTPFTQHPVKEIGAEKKKRNWSTCHPSSKLWVPLLQLVAAHIQWQNDTQILYKMEKNECYYFSSSPFNSINSRVKRSLPHSPPSSSVSQKQRHKLNYSLNRILNYSACLRLQEKTDFNFSARVSSITGNFSEKTISKLLGILSSCTKTTMRIQKLRLLHLFLWVTLLPRTSSLESVLLKCFLLSYAGDKLGNSCSHFCNVIWWMLPYLCLQWVIVTELN